MLPSKSASIYGALALTVLLGLWVGSYLFLRSTYGSDVTFGSCSFTFSSTIDHGGVDRRDINLAFLGASAEGGASFANVIYWPLRMADQQMTGRSVEFFSMTWT